MSPSAARTVPLPEGESKRVAVETMFDRIAPAYDRTNRVISLGLDRRWRHRAVASLGATPGAWVLDVGCGTGDLCRELAAAGLAAVGVDRSAGMLAAARTDQALVRADAEQLPFPDACFDGVITGFALRNVVDLDAVFHGAARLLRPGGRFVALETAVPERRAWRLGNTVWFRWTVPLLGRLLAGDADAYRYLPRSTAYLPPTPVLASRLEAAGLVEVRWHTMTAGSVQLLVANATVTSLAAPTPRLQAVTRPFAAPPDLLEARGPDGFAWLADGAGFVTAGVAARVPAAAAEATLAGFEVDDPLGWPGTGPLAVGALPFDPDKPGELVIPSTVVGRERGRPQLGHRGRRRVRPPAPAGTRRGGSHVVDRDRADEPGPLAGDGRRRVGRDPAGEAREGRAGPVGRHRRWTRRRRCPPCSPSCAPASRAASCTTPTASSARHPSCSCGGPGDTWRPARSPGPPRPVRGPRHGWRPPRRTPANISWWSTGWSPSSRRRATS